MTIKSITLASSLIAALAAPALAEGEIMIKDAYLRVATKAAKSGAAFMELHNMGTDRDQLLSVHSDIAARTELHTHEDMGDGVMKMRHVEEGFAIPAGASHDLARGGDHVMFMGLTRSLTEGDTVPLVLVFEHAGEITIEVPVDNSRAAGAMTQGGHDHSGGQGDAAATGKHKHH
ncbi:copper chaperone PCu(A)C [Cognatishimia sp. SS12]|uniref:copper chaperone PCu(A)C n=1 Tax=Cognatishimia sp. SS12 TaxID=2979465 RepID=UPI00232B22A0|nr:copper chaperone PCu(A)C [Cognatishimia sp. SS12]MDC0738144.1 copper chaperone PCu(A)C [Cognatishimia sp. SS12]